MRSGKRLVLLALLVLAAGVWMAVADAAPVETDTAGTSLTEYLPAVFKGTTDTTWISPIEYLPAVYKDYGHQP